MSGIERRRGERSGTDRKLRFFTAKEVMPEVAMVDLSVFGCQIEQHRIAVEVGQIVVVRPSGMEGLSGTIRWIAGEKVGIEFDGPLHPAVMEHLLLAATGSLRPEGLETISPCNREDRVDWRDQRPVRADWVFRSVA